MKVWVDDIRSMPSGFNVWVRSVNEAIALFNTNADIELLDLDHDAGDYVNDGGDYIKILDYMEEHNLSYPLHIHSMNPVGVLNMRRIIKRNGWKEID